MAASADGRANIFNNVGAFLLAGLVAVAVAWWVARREGRGRLSRADLIGLLVTIALVLAGIALFLWAREFFDRWAHYLAAIPLFLVLVAVMVVNAVSYARTEAAQKGREMGRAELANRYLAIAALTVALVVTLGLVTWLGHWRHGTFWLEVVVIAAFAVFWAVQTAELWGGRGTAPRPRGRPRSSVEGRRGRHPVAPLEDATWSESGVLEHPAVGLDDGGGPDIGVVTGDEDLGEPEVSGHREHEAQGLSRDATPAGAGPHRVADVPAHLAQEVVELVPQRDRPEIGVGRSRVGDPQEGARHPPRRPWAGRSGIADAKGAERRELGRVLEGVPGEGDPAEAVIGREDELAVAVAVLTGELLERGQVGPLEARVGLDEGDHGRDRSDCRTSSSISGVSRLVKVLWGLTW